MHDRPPTYTVEGEFFVGGKAAHGALIAFHPTQETDKKLPPSRAVADEQGKFQLSTFINRDGAPEGDYAVTVYWPARPLDPDGGNEHLPPDQLAGRFSNPAGTPLRACVEKQPVVLDRIDLLDKEVMQSKEYMLK